MPFNIRTAYEHDHEHFGDIESVTYTSRNPAGTPVENVKALREVQSRAQIGSGDAGTEHEDVVFHVWGSTLSSTPKGGDKITDASSNHWTVLAVAEIGREPRWRLPTVKQVT